MHNGTTFSTNNSLAFSLAYSLECSFEFANKWKMLPNTAHKNKNKNNYTAHLASCRQKCGNKTPFWTGPQFQVSAETPSSKPLFNVHGTDCAAVVTPDTSWTTPWLLFPPAKSICSPASFRIARQMWKDLSLICKHRKGWHHESGFRDVWPRRTPRDMMHTCEVHRV